MLCAAAGITAALLAVPYAWDALRLGGAAYLAWLAWQCVRPGGQPVFAPRPMPREPAARLFSIGFATAALNPKVALFYMAVLPPFLDPSAASVFLQSAVLGRGAARRLRRERRGAGLGRGRHRALPRHAAVLDGGAALGARRGARAARGQARHAIARLQDPFPMPKRTDIKSILIIGAGPIVIGQACEFDYSGAQACKALRAEGYRVILVNSNPATIMTDPDLADATYIEPITPEMVEKIIAKERPDAVLPTMGGQTALNTAMKLDAAGVLEKYGCELIGAKAEVIDKAEDRLKFRDAMAKIGIESPRSGIAHSMAEARAALDEVKLPCVIRPSFTLGGTGGGIAYNREEFEQIVAAGLDASMTNEVLVEESVLGWKEFEMEVVRDRADNCIIVCSIENVDADGRAHRRQRDGRAGADPDRPRVPADARRLHRLPARDRRRHRRLQRAVRREPGRRAHGGHRDEPARLALLGAGLQGDRLPDRQDRGEARRRLHAGRAGERHHAVTPASFEPTIDYVVVKIPRFTFEKFPGTPATLTTSMKSVGEAMAIGRSFAEALQKGLRSMETGLSGLDEVPAPGDGSAEAFQAALATPRPDRVLMAAQAMRAGVSLDAIHDACKFDPWFLREIERDRAGGGRGAARPACRRAPPRCAG